MADPKDRETNRGFEAREVIEQKDLGMDEGYDEGYQDDNAEFGEQEIGAKVGARETEDQGDDEDFVDIDTITSREDFEVVNPDVEEGQEPERE